MTGSRRRVRGFTLIELMIVFVLVGVVGTYAFVMNASPGQYTLLSQGETLAADLRHAQSLATTWSRSLNVSLAEGVNGTYSVSCAAAGASPCNASPVVDPATGAAFSVSVQKGVSIGGPAGITIDSLGKPSAAASYTLSAGGATVTVSMAPVSGFVTVTAP